ncbi:nitroimidazol reductase NimA-like FMN-containing flavoprotein (pyridoxamine 5'-phosphate oxidase superfamily) [Mycetocola sp. CAN_C7]|uniref:pyridoxamine 5'-phosphate oxidase family protein n=1 Tax=Mycetocola sp. CAN_C7 TaxID=2787724 RepID=UPI0018CA83FE
MTTPHTDNPYALNEYPAPAPADVESLDQEECWRLLGSTDFARLAVADDHGADIFPINFLAKGRSLFFRSGPGTKIVSLTRTPGVALEVDGIDDRKRWSVVVRGDARRLNVDAEIDASGVADLHSLTTSDKWNYFEVVPRVVTGIRFRAARRPMSEPVELADDLS